MITMYAAARTWNPMDNKWRLFLKITIPICLILFLIPVTAKAYPANTAKKQAAKDVALIYAVERENTNRIRWLLNHGASTNARSADGKTPLGIAAQYGSVNIIKLLLNHKPDLNRQDWSGDTPLISAISNSDPKSALLLIQAGADVNATGHSGTTALMEAASSDHTSTVLALLQHGADANAQDTDGSTALIKGAFNAKIVKALIDHGADVNHADKSGTTALRYAVLSDPEPVRLLLSAEAKVNVRDWSRYTPLSIAASEGHLEIVKLLLDHGAYVSVAGGRSPLAESLNWGAMDARHLIEGHNLADYRANKLKIAEMFLAHGASIKDTDEDGCPTSLLAASWAWPPMMELVLTHGGDVNARTRDGETTLMKAADAATPEEVNSIAGNDSGQGIIVSTRADIEQTVRLLLNKGVAVNATDSANRPALWWAASKGDISVVKILLQARADPTIMATEGFGTALTAATVYNHPDLVKLLRDAIYSKRVLKK